MNSGPGAARVRVALRLRRAGRVDRVRNDRVVVDRVRNGLPVLRTPSCHFVPVRYA